MKNKNQALGTVFNHLANSETASSMPAKPDLGSVNGAYIDDS